MYYNAKMPGCLSYKKLNNYRSFLLVCVQAMENFAWNIRVLRGQADLLSQAKKDCNEYIRQVSNEYIRQVSNEHIRQVSNKYIRQVSNKYIRQVSNKYIRQVSNGQWRVHESEISSESIKQISNE